MIWLPPKATNSTDFTSPGSKRTALPDGTFKRIPRAKVRSNLRALLVSKMVMRANLNWAVA